MNSLKKNTNLNSILVLIVVFSFVMVQFVQAVTPTPIAPGSDGDPLVTKSYVDKQIKSLTTSVNTLTTKLNGLTASKNELSNIVDELTKTVNKQATTIATLNTLVDSLSKRISSLEKKQIFKSVTVKAGKKLLTGTSTQLILKQGKATAISGKAGGLSDLLTAKDLVSAAKLTANHLILALTNDGRGFKAVTDITVLICGSYTIA